MPKPGGGFEFFECDDEVLSLPERLAEREERLYKSRESQRMKGQEDHSDPFAQLGRPMHHSEVVHRLRSIIPGLTVAAGHGTNISLYRPSPRSVDAPQQYIGYLYSGENPEYSTWLLDQNDVPVQERRGWRTTLLRLILSRTITERDAEKAFPRPSNGAVASHYRRQLYRFRNPETKVA